jgi:hypothetical protein
MKNEAIVGSLTIFFKKKLDCIGVGYEVKRKKTGYVKTQGTPTARASVSLLSLFVPL